MKWWQRVLLDIGEPDDEWAAEWARQYADVPAGGYAPPIFRGPYKA